MFSLVGISAASPLSIGGRNAIFFYFKILTALDAQFIQQAVKYARHTELLNHNRPSDKTYKCLWDFSSKHYLLPSTGW
jgi:hypothetical protein